MIKKKLIDIPIYDQKLMLVDCDNPKKLAKLFKRTNYNAKKDYQDKDDIYADTITSDIKIKKEQYRCIYVVFNSNNTLSNLSVSILAHEAIHIMQFLYRIIGETFNSGENLEHDAYLMEYLMKELCDFMGVENQITANE